MVAKRGKTDHDGHVLTYLVANKDPHVKDKRDTLYEAVNNKR